MAESCTINTYRRQILRRARAFCLNGRKFLLSGFIKDTHQIDDGIHALNSFTHCFVANIRLHYR